MRISIIVTSNQSLYPEISPDIPISAKITPFITMVFFTLNYPFRYCD